MKMVEIDENSVFPTIPWPALSPELASIEALRMMEVTITVVSLL